ncbi:tyrosine hydroxylase 2 [Tachysurus ichikawai]
MKMESVAQTVPFSGRKRSLIEDARRDRERERDRERDKERDRERDSESTTASPGPSRSGDNLVFEEKSGKVTLHLLFTQNNDKHAGFFKTGKVFEVSN